MSDVVLDIPSPELTDALPEGVASRESPSLRTRGDYDFVREATLKPGLSEIARYGGYNQYMAPGNTDPYVRESLKTFDRDLYDQIYGFTRRPTGLKGMYESLAKFGDEPLHFDSLNRHQKRCMTKAIARARKAFRLPYKHEPLDWDEVGQHLRRDTAAGATFPGKKKGDVLPEIYTEARWLGHRMKQGGKGSFNPTKVRFPPAMATQRGGLSEIDEPKTRLAWIYPAEMLVVEGLWAPVMYREFMKLPGSPMLNGKSSQRLFSEWAVNVKEGEKLYGLDFKSFDTKVPAWLIRVAFSILHQNVAWDTWRGKPVSPVNRQKWRNVWDGMVWYFINTPILMPDGRMFRKHQGVPSGTWFTQLIDSVVNYILVEYMTTCQDVEPQNLKVLGDDSAFRSGLDFSIERGKEDAIAVGMTLSPKSEVTTDPTELKLLGTTYRNGHAHRPTDEWFKLALYPENPVSELGVSLTRLVGLWIGGAMWDTRFSKYLEYYQTCYECPKYGNFSKDQRRWLEVVHSGKAPRGWTTGRSLFWRSFFYTL
ncbi:RNA-dependent RNA polymerase [Phyllosticta citriasiana partitivirus 1]|nr:RNA-dependent RNA polymerase [Phyllosticta citriasiana partitivirus 1]